MTMPRLRIVAAFGLLSMLRANMQISDLYSADLVDLGAQSDLLCAGREPGPSSPSAVPNGGDARVSHGRQ
jgi:hypothetical protein